MSPSFIGVHHLKFPVSDLEASADWVRRAFGAERITRCDHHDENGRLCAVMLHFPGLGAPLELRLAPGAARELAGYDPVTLGVADRRELDAWLRHLDDGGFDNATMHPEQTDIRNAELSPARMARE